MKKITTTLILFICVGLIGSDMEGTVSEKEGLKIREKASTASRQIGFIPFQETVLVLDENGPTETLYGIKSNWKKIKYKNITGWAFGGFINRSSSWETNDDIGQYAVGIRKRDLNFEYTGKKLSKGVDCDGVSSGFSSELTLGPGNKAISSYSSDGGDQKRPECKVGSFEYSRIGTYKVSSGKLEIHLKNETSSIKFSYYDGIEMSKDEWKKKCKPKTETKAIDEKIVLFPYECKKKDGSISNIFLISGEEFMYGFPK